tara:strand:+ start:109 stop:573 length:465 start_codon:yes stop_codon:yes gene_type:complete
MKIKDYKIYLLTFPNKDTYVGHTSQILNQRYSRHRCDAKVIKVETPKSKLCLEYKFKEVVMVEVDRIYGTYNDAEKLEQKWINKLNPTLNTNKSHRTKEEEAECHRQSAVKYYYRNKEEVLEKNRVRANLPHNKAKKREYDKIQHQNRLANQSS